MRTRSVSWGEKEHWDDGQMNESEVKQEEENGEEMLIGQWYWCQKQLEVWLQTSGFKIKMQEELSLVLPVEKYTVMFADIAHYVDL